jgi:DNA polymerase-3 subunit beta
MEIEIERGVLRAALGAAGKVVEAKAVRPIMSMVLLHATNDGRLRVVGADGGLTSVVECTLSCRVLQGGASAVPEKLLRDLVNNLPEGTLRLKTIDSSLQLRAGRQTMHLAAGDAEDYPDLPALDSPAEFTVNRGAFARAVQRTAQAAATDNGRPVLQGVQITVVDGNLLCVATDGIRLSRQIIQPWDDYAVSLLVPAQALSEVARIASAGGDDQVSVAVTPKLAAFTIAGKELTTRIIVRLAEDRYPDWVRIVRRPDIEEPAANVTVQRDDLLAALKLAMPFIADDHQRIRFTLEGDTLRVATATSAKGESAASVAVTPVKQPADSFTVMAAAPLVIEALQVLPAGELVTLTAHAPKSPLTFQTNDYFALIMPMA